MKSFSESKLHQSIIKTLADKGIHEPSDIQAEAIPILLEHKGDFVGRSATGTGKTIAFGAPLLSRIDTSKGIVQAVILSPTRELCEQVGKELSEMSKDIENLKVQAIYGGLSLKNQVHELSNGVQVIVATPGRLMDMVSRKVVKLNSLKFVVFDEADQMLLTGFRTDIDKILDSTDRTYSTWLFSATLPDEIDGIIKKYLHKELKKTFIGSAERTNDGIEHCVVKVEAEEKQNVLLHFLTRFGSEKVIIFCRTKSGAQKLYKQLSKNKFQCGAIHGDLPQGLRNKVMDQYRAGSINILIATDVASRGVDVEDVNYVIQYHLADTTEAYLHRSGRTSRAGKTGVNLTFIFQEERRKLETIEKELNLNLKRLPLPSVNDQKVNKAILWARKISNTKPMGKKLDDSSKQDFKKELEHLSNDELMEKLLAEYMSN